MLPKRYRWDDYFDDSGQVLRNIPGITNPDELADFEYAATFRRSMELVRGDVVIPRTFDGDHLRAIHGHLFQDVYEWAGEYRTVGIEKPRPSFTWLDSRVPEVEHFLPSGFMDQATHSITQSIKETPWRRLAPVETAAALADVYADVNYAHIAREGNGRVTRIFMRELADHAGYNITGPQPDFRTFITATVEANRGNRAQMADLYLERMQPRTQPALDRSKATLDQLRQLDAQPTLNASLERPTLAMQPRGPFL